MKKNNSNYRHSFLFQHHYGSSKTELKTEMFNGVIVGGYIDDGAFLNFMGPNIKLKASSYIIGMLPSLKFKEDEGATKNAFVTSSLGMSITYIYKSIAIQIPRYYKGKTSAINGRWNVGVGINHTNF